MASVAATVSSATASSFYSGWEASKVHDGNRGTAWNAGAAGSGMWVYLDLGSSTTCYGFSVYWHLVNNTPAAYKIQGSDNASTWTDIQTVSSHEGGYDEYPWPDGETYRYFRFYVTTGAGGDWVILTEFEVYTTYDPDYPLAWVSNPTVSSGENDANLAVDGDTNSNIYSQGTTGEWLKLDLGSAKTIESFTVFQDNINEFRVEYSSARDGTYTQLETFSSSGDHQVSTQYDLATPTEARWWRLYTTAVDGANWPRWYEVSAGEQTAVLLNLTGTGSETIDGRRFFTVGFEGTGSETFTHTRETFGSLPFSGIGDLDGSGEFFGYHMGVAGFSGVGDLGGVGAREVVDRTIDFSGSASEMFTARVSDSYSGTVAFGNDDASLTLRVHGQPERPIDTGAWYRWEPSPGDIRFSFVWGAVRSRTRGYKASDGWERVSPKARFVTTQQVEDASWATLLANQSDDADVLLGKMRTVLEAAGFTLVN